MIRNGMTSAVRWLATGFMLAVGVVGLSAQSETDSIVKNIADIEETIQTASEGKTEITAATDTLPEFSARAKERRTQVLGDSAVKKRQKRDWQTWKPNPQRALWLAMVLPGAGQIYNRKYWKLPIFYGGMMGCLYAMNWNNMMYKDYSQAYLDIMDDDPTTESYNKFLHLGRKIDSSNEERYKTLFKSRKDRFRRWRDMSFFCLLGVYALSVIDAYVDAELSEFDISKDLSMKVSPAIISGKGSRNALDASSALGLQCSLNF